MNKRFLVLIVSVLWGGLSHSIAPCFAQETIRPCHRDAIAGTWALCQASSVEDIQRQMPQIEAALATPHLRGFCLRVPWRSIDTHFTLLETGYSIARRFRVKFSVRFMAGRHTPRRVFDAGSPFYVTPTGERVPLPFYPDGRPNVLFEKHYEELVQRLANWCRQKDVPLLHAAWYGRDWAELDHGQLVRTAPG